MTQTTSGRCFFKRAAAREQQTMLEGLVTVSLSVLALVSWVGRGRGSQRAADEQGEPQEETSSCSLLACARVEAEGPQGRSVCTACQVFWEFQPLILKRSRWQRRLEAKCWESWEDGPLCCLSPLPLQESHKGS